VREGDIICVRCGTNLLTGQKIADEQEEVVKRASNSQSWMFAVFTVVLLAVVAGGAYYFLQDPIKEAERLAAEGNSLEAIEVLREYAASNPGHVEAQLLLGKLNWRVGRYADAANAFDAAFDAAPQDPEPGRLAVLAAGRLATADGGQRQIEALERLAARHPDDAQAKHLLGLARGLQGDTAGQLQTLDTLVQQSPENANAHESLGIARAIGGDTAGAAEALKRAESLGAQDVQVAMGLLAGLQGDDAAARTQLGSAVEQAGAAEAYVQARLGLLYVADGEYQQALAAFNAAQSAPEIVAVVSFFRAICLKELGLQSDALAAFEQLSLGETDFAADAAVQTALIHMGTGELVRAEEALRRASQYGAATAQFHTAQARLNSLNNQPAPARQALDNAKRLNSQYPAAYLESGLLHLRRQVEADGIRELERYVELAGKDNARGRVAEIQLLVEQLRQSMESAGTTEVSSR
jgi:tetratricopeptide (TPR) repeat protein